ncbi:MAG: 50S ribosomal protein L24 [Candidatus Peregrinibacteria bacterium]
MKIKVNDNILVIAGKYKGKTGKVMRVYDKTHQITAEKINIRTRHIKRTSTRAGERIQYEAPFSISNVMVICPSCSKPTRVGYLTPKQGKKYRACKRCKESLETEITQSKKKKS